MTDASDAKKSSSTSAKDSVKQLAALIKDIRMAMLTTTSTTGSLHSRPMATQETEFDGQLWFFTAAHSGKVFELKKDQHVNLSYAAPDKQRYVSDTGKGNIVRDADKMRELWSPGLRAWFPKGLDDPELALLRIDVDQAEYWESPNGVAVQLLGFAKAILTGKPLQVGKHENLSLH